MPTQSHSFRRLVLSLHPTTPDRAMRMGVEFASLLNIELLGVFLEDIRLAELAAIPFVRELTLPGGAWRPIHPGQLTQELQWAAYNAERLLVSAAKELSTAWRFEVIRGRMEESFGSFLREGDVAVVVEPFGPTGRLTVQFSQLIEVALGSASAVLLIPARPAWATGPVVALAAAPDDASILAAADIAAAAREELIIVQMFPGETGQSVRPLAEGTCLKVTSFFAGADLASQPALLSSLVYRLKGRLLVLSGRSGLPPADLAQHVPVLAIGFEAAPAP